MDGAFATVYRNTIVGAVTGVSAFNDGVITAGEDNIIDQSHWGVKTLEDTSIKLNFNDITNSFVPILAEFITSDLDCNWWAIPAGPASTADVVDPSIFTPWATAPIAGTDHSGCSPLGDENLLVGTWTATSIIRGIEEILIGTGLSFSVTLRDDLTFSESVSGDTDNLFCGDATSCTDGGTYVFTSTHFSLCDPHMSAEPTSTLPSTPAWRWIGSSTLAGRATRSEPNSALPMTTSFSVPSRGSPS